MKKIFLILILFFNLGCAQERYFLIKNGSNNINSFIIDENLNFFVGKSTEIENSYVYKSDGKYIFQDSNFRDTKRMNYDKYENKLKLTVIYNKFSSYIEYDEHLNKIFQTKEYDYLLKDGTKIKDNDEIYQYFRFIFSSKDGDTYTRKNKQLDNYEFINDNIIDNKYFSPVLENDDKVLGHLRLFNNNKQEYYFINAVYDKKAKIYTELKKEERILLPICFWDDESIIYNEDGNIFMYNILTNKEEKLNIDDNIIKELPVFYGNGDFYLEIDEELYRGVQNYNIDEVRKDIMEKLNKQEDFIDFLKNKYQDINIDNNNTIY